MTTELYWLTLTALMTALFWVPYVLNRMVVSGLGATLAGASPKSEGHSDWANRAIKAPGSFAHRYYQEDLWYGLGPFLALAQIAGVETPCARALLELGECAAGAHAPSGRRTAAEMGISGLDKNALLAFVTERVHA